MKFAWDKCSKPIIGLAPMADMTDSPFCRIVKSLASPIVWREMVSAEAVVRENAKTLNMAVIHSDERPLIQQIFGADPEAMANAAKIIVETFAPDGIDLNMGCPVYKITSNFNGAALMKEPKLAAKIVGAIKKKINVPLSVKIRAGWAAPDECIEFAKVLESAGADLISIHGRTKLQAYSGKSDREAVRLAKDAVSIPVLYNGDIFSADDFFTAIEETKCDGALIARGALGNPWIFQEIENKIAGKESKPISIAERIRVVKKHLDLHLEHYGVDAINTFRKHLSWYFKGIPNFKQYKQPLMQAKDRETLEKILDAIAS